MRYYQHIIVAALFMQLFISCWARTRFIPDPWPASSSYWHEVDDISSNDNNDNDIADRANLLTMKAKKALHGNYPFGGEERRKKYLGESANFHGGHSLQGLWAMPGRR
ncbi:unnamed protein product [Rotaria sordida]|uniref:Uncharacterized protein n=1 Tax=Rotaria sordida TaxID=392033 RepID=A0A814KXF7_9BILA|nr:unnamed protein product [Rotaria sordida]CAF1014158.1 unnamed protein product [Rotaria sordida]CAF1038575.1 unnamed protein product [Rotaria sordida]CAF1052260.1 unnamed protein product [Rotaria sordida]CAF1057430.1 unnamed protein product [Rotaria sordida]